MQGRLKRAMLRYLAAVIVFTIIFSSIILCIKYRDSLSVTVDMLYKGRVNLMRMRDAGGRVDSLLADIKAVIPARALSGTPEELLLAGLDDLKERIRDSDITVENIQQKGDGAALPVRIKSSVRNYTDFINTVGYLESLSFPFFSIENISLARVQDNAQASIHCEIKGALRMPTQRRGRAVQ